MTNQEMSTELVSPDGLTNSRQYDAGADEERMIGYRTWAVVFSYPNDCFFAELGQLTGERRSLVSEYDRLFRAGLVWLYGAEHLAKNEFQRANLLSDIMGFYTAFGLEPNLERPDSMSCEMDFMHYLIFKRRRLHSVRIAGLSDDDIRQKDRVCRDAEKKFFVEHLEPAAAPIAEKILENTDHPFYVQAAEELLDFLTREKEHFGLVGCAKIG